MNVRALFFLKGEIVFDLLTTKEKLYLTYPFDALPERVKRKGASPWIGAEKNLRALGRRRDRLFQQDSQTNLGWL